MIPSLDAIDSERVRRDRAACVSFEAFVRLAWSTIRPERLQWNWHMSLVCQAYEKCARGETRSLVVNLPPGGSKSILTSVFFPAWVWTFAPGMRFCFASSDQTLVNRDARQSVELMQSRWYQARWGDIVNFPRKVQAIEEVQNSALGLRLGTTPGAKAIGWHFNFQVFDDLIKPAELTPVALAAVENWRSGTMSSRYLAAPSLKCRIMIAQRLHVDDPPAHEIEEGATTLILPMNFDPMRAAAGDPRTVEGELLDPVRFPAEAVAALRKALGGINAAAQLDQLPVPAGGAVFQREWLEHSYETPPKLHATVLSVDCAFKGTADSDYVAIQVWGRANADYYLLDQHRARLTFSDTVRAIRAMRKKWPHVTGCLIEDAANGPAVIDTLAKDMGGIIPVKPAGGKEARANAVSPFFEAGNVHLPRTDWVDLEYRPELLAFPRGRNDDQVDATTQALTYLHQKKSYLSGLTVDAMKKLADG